MKIESLAILSLAIILPMAIILGSYTSNQIKTVNLQLSYDTKLQNATNDAIKAFQMNMSNSTTSNLANSKMRDIKASIQTFYSSLSSNFRMEGYGEEVLKDYVPAVVYTLYDGYYIYSAYDNQLDNQDVFYPLADYKDADEVGADKIYGLKPYIYYSCRYKPNSNSDFVITYSLDSYITIQGIIDDKPVNESGYLLTGVDYNSGIYTYKGVEIKEENNKDGLIQKVYVDKDEVKTTGDPISVEGYEAGRIQRYPYKKINGVKYYKESEKVFTMMNDVKIYQPSINADTITKNDNAIKYYKEAFEFKQKILGETPVPEGEPDLSVLKDLKTSDAVDSYGKKYTEMGEDNPYAINRNIFQELGNTSENGPYIEDIDSDFNTHKSEVMKNSIETNLIAAISNYNKVSSSATGFSMPKLKDKEWEIITQNTSMITFLQGLSIGGKVYSGHAIVQNTLTEDFVSENSIYISNNSTYHNITAKELVNGEINIDNAIGLLNIDFEKRTGIAYYKTDGIDAKKNIYYYPREEYASYNSVINLNYDKDEKIKDCETIAKCMEVYGKQGTGTKYYKIAQMYYTALGRERKSMYRVTNKLEQVQEELFQ